jgi:hypothetical protein
MMDRVRYPIQTSLCEVVGFGWRHSSADFRMVEAALAFLAQDKERWCALTKSDLRNCNYWRNARPPHPRQRSGAGNDGSFNGFPA